MSTAFFWIFIALLALGTPVVFALLIGPGLTMVLDEQRQFFALCGAIGAPDRNHVGTKFQNFALARRRSVC